MSEKVDSRREPEYHPRQQAANDSARTQWQGPVRVLQQQPRMSAALELIHMRQQQGRG